MKKPYNFGAGPATLPESILIQAQEELLDWHHEGVSILEIGHRTEAYMKMMQEAEHDLRLLLSIPTSYHVLFLGGAARSQFSLIPMNFRAQSDSALYIISGVWSSMAYDEALKLGNTCAVELNNTEAMVDLNSICKPNCSYAYYTPNETINGIRIATPPKVRDIPLIADMTSCLLSEPICLSDYGMVFAGAQKNISCAGLTIVIIHDDMLKKTGVSPLPTMFDYKTHVQHHSLYATPPMFQCYLAAKMFKWLLAKGGVKAIYELNCQKAKLLYDFIDASALYTCRVDNPLRSIMNVCFTLNAKGLEGLFLQQAQEAGLIGLQGHRLVGGFRASLYNAMPIEGVLALIKFMQDFANQHLC